MLADGLRIGDLVGANEDGIKRVGTVYVGPIDAYFLFNLNSLEYTHRLCFSSFILRVSATVRRTSQSLSVRERPRVYKSDTLWLFCLSEISTPRYTKFRLSLFFVCREMGDAIVAKMTELKGSTTQ